MRISDWSSDVCSSDLFDRQSFDQRLSEGDRQRVAAAETRPSLFDQVEAWLERTPFVEFGGYRFQETYRGAVTGMLDRDAAYVRGNPTLVDAEKEAELKRLASARERFEAVLDQARHRALPASTEARRVGKECVSTGRSWVAPYN